MTNLLALKTAQSYMFRTGSNHNAVRALKGFLNDSPKTQVSNLPVNNLFDAQTGTALAEFQKSKGLIGTGKMDFKTWLTIGAEMNPWQIRAVSMHDSTLRDLLELGTKKASRDKTAEMEYSFNQQQSFKSGADSPLSGI